MNWVILILEILLLCWVLWSTKIWLLNIGLRNEYLSESTTLIAGTNIHTLECTRLDLVWLGELLLGLLFDWFYWFIVKILWGIKFFLLLLLGFFRLFINYDNININWSELIQELNWDWTNWNLKMSKMILEITTECSKSMSLKLIHEWFTLVRSIGSLFSSIGCEGYSSDTLLSSMSRDLLQIIIRSNLQNSLLN